MWSSKNFADSNQKAFSVVDECRRLVAADGGVFAGIDQDAGGMVVKGKGGLRYRLSVNPVRIDVIDDSVKA